MLPSGVILATHFDNMDLQQAENLTTGFTHFHNLKNDTHGGTPGAEGVWFVHVAVRNFEAPWGAVSPGVDQNFMVTPTCFKGIMPQDFGQKLNEQQISDLVAFLLGQR